MRDRDIRKQISRLAMEATAMEAMEAAQDAWSTLEATQTSATLRKDNAAMYREMVRLQGKLKAAKTASVQTNDVNLNPASATTAFSRKVSPAFDGGASRKLAKMEVSTRYISRRAARKVTSGTKYNPFVATLASRIAGESAAIANPMDTMSGKAVSHGQRVSGNKSGKSPAKRI